MNKIKEITQDNDTFCAILEDGTIVFNNNTYELKHCRKDEDGIVILKARIKSDKPLLDEQSFRWCVERADLNLMPPVQSRSTKLNNRLRNLREELVLDLKLAEHRPDGWLPRIVFVENDEYEAGFSQYVVKEINSDGTFLGINEDTAQEEVLPLSEINIDWLMLLHEMYESLCLEEKLDENVRRCDHCGKPMKEGYYLGGEYACSDECCLALYNGDKKQMEEDLSHAEEDFSECYYTEWESYICD